MEAFYAASSGADSGLITAVLLRCRHRAKGCNDRLCLPSPITLRGNLEAGPPSPSTPPYIVPEAKKGIRDAQ